MKFINIGGIMEKEIEEIQNIEKNEVKKRFTILGFSIWTLFAYFIIYRNSIWSCYKGNFRK